jgi:Family of unknown function (DUF6812)
MHVPKEKVKVTILVDRFRVVGDMYKFPGARLIDLVNMKDTAYIPVTEADVYSLADGKKLFSTTFIGINRNAMAFFYPMEEEEAQAQM